MLAGTAHPFRSLARPTRSCGQRGAAYVEGVIVVVFMIIIFAGAQYLARYFHAKQTALLTARRCAWIHSRNACTNDAARPLPADCPQVLGQLATEPNPGLRQSVSRATGNPGATPNNSTSSNPNQMEGKVRGSIDSQLNPMLEMLVGQSITATDRNTIGRTPVTALAPGEIGASYYLPCNLKAEKPLDVVKNVWSGLDVDIP